MKPLYFSALAKPHVAPVLAQQVHETLRPFVAYLNAAKRAAREREARSWVGWEPVPLERPIRLEPLDSLIELTVEGYCYRLEGWHGPPPGMPLFVGATFRPLQPLRVDVHKDGLMLTLSEELQPGEAVYWAGQPCDLQHVAPSLPERLHAVGAAGSAAVIRHRFQVQGRQRLVIEGRDVITLQNSQGEPIAFRMLPSETDATELRSRQIRVPWSGERILTLQTPPDEEQLTADNAVRWIWSDAESRGRRKRGVWVRLLSEAGTDADVTVDPRAAYCEEGIRSVRTKKGGGDSHEFRVYNSRRSPEYRLELDRLPPAGTQLFLPANLNGLNRQLDAVYRLKDGPLPHQRSLLTLCENPKAADWPPVQSVSIADDKWYVLRDARWEGTSEQRRFVAKALGSPDFSFLEGPPGSGKTHAICELVLQLIARKQRVLLCSTTHVAVDNVLERLAGVFPQVEAVRIGKTDKVDPRVVDCQLDERIDRLVQRWEADPGFAGSSPRDLEQMARMTVLASANLTCGTTTGILRHPYLDTLEAGTAPSWPHFDVLIVDEASKTTLQEFLVPAQLARRWIIVGDVRQLPPFSEPKDLEASLTEVSAEDGQSGPGSRGSRLSDAYQRACLLFARLTHREAGSGRVRWLIDEPEDVLAALVAEVDARGRAGESHPVVARIVRVRQHAHDITVAELRAGENTAIWLLAAQWILVPSHILPDIDSYLPADLLRLRIDDAPSQQTFDSKAVGCHAFRHAHWARERGQFRSPLQVRRGVIHTSTADLLEAERSFLREQSWAKQIAWRLGRVHQLMSAKNGGDRAQRQNEIERHLPIAKGMEWVALAVDAIRDVGVRSVIETLRVPRAQHRVRRESALTQAIPGPAWDARSVLLTRQHRMHPEISALPSKLFYDGSALLDANTLQGRDQKVGWGFLPHAAARRLWVDIAGHEDRGVNPEEVEAMRELLVEWKRWASNNPRKDSRPWEVACLSFYNKQELAIRDMLRGITGQRSHETRFELPHTRLSCATVDRFQGREADLVLLSFRNVRRPGHADSPNRLNVAITRARFMLVLFGSQSYFARCPSQELTELAEQTSPLRLPNRRTPG